MRLAPYRLATPCCLRWSCLPPKNDLRSGAPQRHGHALRHPAGPVDIGILAGRPIPVPGHVRWGSKYEVTSCPIHIRQEAGTRRTLTVFIRRRSAIHVRAARSEVPGDREACLAMVRAKGVRNPGRKALRTLFSALSPRFRRREGTAPQARREAKPARWSVI